MLMDCVVSKSLISMKKARYLSSEEKGRVCLEVQKEVFL